MRSFVLESMATSCSSIRPSWAKEHQCFLQDSFLPEGKNTEPLAPESRSGGGAALMGTGGVLALGCSIGQGLTGFSTLALASLIAFAGILLGTAAGLRGALRVRPLAAA